MTLICFASQKGSPGATLTALAVAASFPITPGRRKILLEADCTGGTLALRYQLPTEPGLLTLAAAIRSSQENELLWQHTQELPGGLSIVACPDGPDQVYAALAASGRSLGRWLEALPDVDVICDVGRLTPNSPTIDFVAEASAVLMVARPNVEQLQPAARRMATLAPVINHLGWVLIGDSPYGPADVESAYGMPVVGVIADDSRAAAKLESGVVSSKLVRSPLVRSAGSLAGVLADWLRPAGVVPPVQNDNQPGFEMPPPQHGAPMPPPQNGAPMPVPLADQAVLAEQPAQTILPNDSASFPAESWDEAETYVDSYVEHPNDVALPAPSVPAPPTNFNAPSMPSSPSADQPPTPATTDDRSEPPIPAWSTAPGSELDPLVGNGASWAPPSEFAPPASDHEWEAPPVSEFAPPANDDVWVAAESEFGSVTDSAASEASEYHFDSNVVGQETMQFSGPPDFDFDLGSPVAEDNGATSGPPLPPSSLTLPPSSLTLPPSSLALPPSSNSQIEQPDFSSEPLTPHVEVAPVEEIAAAEPQPQEAVIEDRGPIAEPDELQGWVVSPSLVEAPQPVATVQPIAEWILEPVVTPQTHNGHENLVHEASEPDVDDLEQAPASSNDRMVSTAIAAEVDGRQRQDWSGLRNARAWKRVPDGKTSNGADQGSNLR